MLRNRWTVLSVLVLLLMALPQSVCLADVGILNGDFSAWTPLDPTNWVRDDSSFGVFNQVTDLYHTASPSAGAIGGGDTSFSQCVDTSTWSGPVEVGGWVYGSNFYDATNGRINVTWYGETDCSGNGTQSTLGLVQDGYWAHVSTVFDLPAVHPDTYVSMKVTIFAKGDEGIHFDDVYASASPTAITLRSATAHAGLATAVAPVVLVVGIAGYGLLRRRRGS